MTIVEKMQPIDWEAVKFMKKAILLFKRKPLLGKNEMENGIPFYWKEEVK